MEPGNMVEGHLKPVVGPSTTGFQPAVTLPIATRQGGATLCRASSNIISTRND